MWFDQPAMLRYVTDRGASSMLIRRSGTQVIGERQTPSLPGEVELAATTDFKLGSVLVQPSTLQLNFGGASRTIEPRVMKVLVLLAGERGSVVSRDRMVDCCWGGRIVSEDAINRCIAKVRRIGADSDAFEVETIPRVGYRLVEARAEAGAPTGRRARPLIMAALAAALIVAIGAWKYWQGTSQAQQPVVAIIPFTALDADPDAKNFAASLTATVASALVQTGARLPDNIRTVDGAHKAGAALIITGVVRRDGPNLHLTAQVTSGKSGTTILSHEFEGADGDALAGQAAAWLVPPVRMWASFLPVERDATVNDEIMRIFLTRSGGDMLRARQLSRSLAAAKPGSGAAQLVFSLLTSDVLDLIASDQRRTAVASARHSALAASRLLPDPARPLAVLNCHLTAPGWHILTPNCDRANRAAVAANPDVPLLPFLFGWELVDSGRFVEAERFADMDLAQSPLGPGQIQLRIVATRMSRDGDADDLLPLLEDRMRRYNGAGMSAYFEFQLDLASGDVTAADLLLNGSNSASGNPHGHPWDAMSAMPAGEPRAVTQLVVRALKSRSAGDVAQMRKGCTGSPGATPPEPAFGACLIGLAMVGDLDSVFSLANRGYRDVDCCTAAEQEREWLASGGDYYPRWELFGKAMAPVRADQRFIEIARRTGLLAYWKSGHPPDFCSFEQAPVCRLLR